MVYCAKHNGLNKSYVFFLRIAHGLHFNASEYTKNADLKLQR
ncbi:hypothetical protein LDG_6081 [Legionella drancourtii LLAP12]|uniref:Uncharacterized protein n=1 Tax=Legionella drancourtii LLAP12 TaxID=658187 RepID=G9ELT0_9GAMM|nr:hypothetical protein LDG_6081 [Legionella drancourtii LLAP12]